jgi:hypothetical protein
MRSLFILRNGGGDDGSSRLAYGVITQEESRLSKDVSGVSMAVSSPKKVTLLGGSLEVATYLEMSPSVRVPALEPPLVSSRQHAVVIEPQLSLSLIISGYAT